MGKQKELSRMFFFACSTFFWPDLDDISMQVEKNTILQQNKHKNLKVKY